MFFEEIFKVSVDQDENIIIDACVFDDFQDMKEIPEELWHDVKVWSLSDES